MGFAPWTLEREVGVERVFSGRKADTVNEHTKERKNNNNEHTKAVLSIARCHGTWKAPLFVFSRCGKLHSTFDT